MQYEALNSVIAPTTIKNIECYCYALCAVMRNDSNAWDKPIFFRL